MVPDYLYENGKVVDSLILDIYHMGLWIEEYEFFMKIQIIDNKIIWELETREELEGDKEEMIKFLEGWEEGYDFLYSLENGDGLYTDPDADPTYDGYFPGNKFLIFKEN